MKRLVTIVNNAEYELFVGYCEKHKISLYQLVKDAIFEKTGIERIEGG